MDCDALIDFNSPLKKGCNMLDPLVPLPQSRANNVHGSIATYVGDNPFDNMVIQISKLNDPFEIIEKEALERNKDNYLLQNQTGQQEETTDDKSNIGKEEIDNSLKSVNINICDSPQWKSSSQLDSSHTKPCLVSDSGHISLNERSLSESYRSPVTGKFSKLYASAQLDKQLLDESSKCIYSGDQDMSLFSVSKMDAFDRSRRSPSPIIPKEKNEVKAFVANRIEKCIEKALNESRKSLNCSFRHRRSLSATSLYTSTMSQDNLYNYSSLKPSYDSSSIASTFRNRSFSKPDLHSSLNTNMWGSQHNVFDYYTGETLANVTSRFNTAFRKSTATSSMYSSCGEFNTGFRKNFTSLSSYRPSNSSVANISSSEVNGDDSVFLKDDTVIMGGKISSCVFMEAKNLSCILQRRARAGDDEPIDADINFLTDGNFEVELVDSDTSGSEDDVKGRNVEQAKEKHSSLGNEDTLKSGSNTSEQRISQDAEEPHLPLSRDKIAGMGLSSKVLQPNKTPMLVPLPPVPLPSSNNGNLVLKPKSQSESKVGKRGPMKAMIPVGNMMRHEVKKENAVPSKQAVGRHNKNDAKLLSNTNNLRKGVLTEDNSQKDKTLPPGTSVQGSPSNAVSGRPIACSTPDGVLPLVSPVVSLQVSHIAKETPVDGGHRRSKSARVTDSARLELESQLTSTPARKPARLVRSKSGLANTSLPKNKQQSPDPISPGEAPAYTSTPLKSITKNSPSFNRIKKPTSVNRKLLQKENPQVEKENLQPRTEQKQRSIWRSSTRRMEV